jgi:uncharacterized protein
MLIKIANLSDGDHSYDFDEGIEKIGLTAPFFGNFKADVTLKKSHSQIILQTQLEVPVMFECDRCTVEYKTSLQTSYQVVYFFSTESLGDESDSLIYLNPNADIIDISKELRDYALLSVPMKKLCSDDCKGLCPVCGQDLNIKECECPKGKVDPRWEPLLKNKKLNNN